MTKSGPCRSTTSRLSSPAQIRKVQKNCGRRSMKRSTSMPTEIWVTQQRPCLHYGNFRNGADTRIQPVETGVPLFVLNPHNPLPSLMHFSRLYQGPPSPRPANWGCVKTALIKSVREGVFVDRKYWTRRSRGRKVLQPVYLSSIVAGKSLTRIDNSKCLHLTRSGCRTYGWVVVKQHQKKDEHLEDEGESEDSDYESGVDKPGSSVTETELCGDESGAGPLPVLSVGSFSR